jgi:hypothetical protein
MNKPHSDPGEEIGRGCDPLFAKGCVRPELEMGMLLPCDVREERSPHETRPAARDETAGVMQRVKACALRVLTRLGFRTR